MNQSMTGQQMSFAKDDQDSGYDVRTLATRIIVLVMLTLFSLATFAAEQGTVHTAPWHGWHMHGFGFWWIFPLLMFIFIIFFFIMFSNRGGWCGPMCWRRKHPESRDPYVGDQGTTSESALDILNKRYASGEIEKDEYEEKKATITASNK